MDEEIKFVESELEEKNLEIAALERQVVECQREIHRLRAVVRKLESEEN